MSFGAVLKSSRRLSIIALATLLAWVGAVYHDVWLELAEVAHHHHEHSGSDHDHDSPEDEGDDSPGEGEHPLILPNIHSTLFVAGAVSSIGTSVSPPDKSPVSGSMWAAELDLRGVDCSNAPPDWRLISEKNAAVLLHLEHCVHSNAPPSIA